MTNGAAAAFVDDNAGDVVAESRPAADLGGWGGCREGIVDTRDGTIEGTEDAVSFPELCFFIVTRFVCKRQ